jgi:hypothetical protein
MRFFSGIAFAVLALTAGVQTGWLPADLGGRALLASDGARREGCNIKGNISIDTQERIYHLPGQRYYSTTKISPEYGEHWFCSEAEARAAGWRKSRV